MPRCARASPLECSASCCTCRPCSFMLIASNMTILPACVPVLLHSCCVILCHAVSCCVTLCHAVSCALHWRRGQSIKVLSQLLHLRVTLVRLTSALPRLNPSNVPHLYCPANVLDLYCCCCCCCAGASPSRCSASCCARPSSGATSCPSRREAGRVQGTAWRMRAPQCWSPRSVRGQAMVSGFIKCFLFDRVRIFTPMQRDSYWRVLYLYLHLALPHVPVLAYFNSCCRVLQAAGRHAGPCQPVPHAC